MAFSHKSLAGTQTTLFTSRMVERPLKVIHSMAMRGHNGQHFGPTNRAVRSLKGANAVYIISLGIGEGQMRNRTACSN